MTPFESYFAACVMAGCHNPNCPDEYVWNLNTPGIWLEKFHAGVDPDVAVDEVFRVLH